MEDGTGKRRSESDSTAGHGARRAAHLEDLPEDLRVLHAAGDGHHRVRVHLRGVGHRRRAARLAREQPAAGAARGAPLHLEQHKKRASEHSYTSSKCNCVYASFLASVIVSMRRF